MPSFSEREGAVPSTRELQIGRMDQALKNAIWNWVFWMLAPPDENSSHYWSRLSTYWSQFAKQGLWDEFMHLNVDEIPAKVLPAVKDWYSRAQWNRVNDFAEYVLNHANAARSTYDKRSGSTEALNGYLTREMSGYRAISCQICSSDKDGVRHALLEESTVTFAEAKFMLVACSAFANFLIESDTIASASNSLGR
jgi:hypothetical protein